MTDRDAEQRLVALLDALPDLLFEVDAEGRFYAFHARSEDLLYAPPEVFLGRTVEEVLPPEATTIIMPALAEAAASGRHFGATYPLEMPTGIRWFELSVASRHWPGSPQRLVCLSRDVTERKHAQEALRRSERLAALGTLAAGLSHEINNPLGAILASVELIEAFQNDPTEREAVDGAVQTIRDSVERAAGILRGVLQFARDETAERSPQDLGQLLQRCRNLVGRTAEQGGVAVDIEIPGGLPPIVVSATQIEQVFVNLLENAIQKSSPGACVEVRIELPADSVRVLIRDHGAGVSKADLERIFDPFHTSRRNEGGTGLGLSIAHAIVKSHGGSIEVQSEPGAGATFSVILPRQTGGHTRHD